MAAGPLTQSHRAVSLATYKQRRDQARAALADASAAPVSDVRAVAERATIDAIATAEERIAALEEIDA